MSVPRFHVPAGLGPASVGGELTLPDAVAHHAVRVTRLGVGDTLVLFDGTGGEYAAHLVGIDKRSARVQVDAFDPVERESPLAVTLFQAIAANDAMDHAVRKAVELGVVAVAPLVTARSAPLPAGERGERRVAHWRQIVVAACEQCGRNRLPVVHEPERLAACDVAGFAAVYVCAPHAAPPPLPAPAGPCAIVVGPEGGLREDEVRTLLDRGARLLSLGPRVLRTETAATAAIAILQARWGDMA